MSKGVRRVVTGEAADVRSTVVSDRMVPNRVDLGGGVWSTEIWKTEAAPAPLDHGDIEPAAGAFALEPPRGGSIFRITDFPPAAVGAIASRDDAIMHRTATIDYGIVLSGSITLVLDEEEIELNTGDTLVQRGANHGWVNKTDKPCSVLFVMIDARLPDGLASSLPM